MNYRPWGPLDWTLSLSRDKDWLLMGALGTEDRCLGTLYRLNKIGVNHQTKLIRVNPIPGTRHYSKTIESLENRLKQFIDHGGSESDISDHELFERLCDTQHLADQMENQCTSVILDVSSLPKRFFFPILKKLKKSNKIQNLIVTYTSPQRYLAEHNLSEGAGKWDYLPGFLGKNDDESSSTLIAAVGFMIESLQVYISEQKDCHTKLLLPFPAPAPAVKRSWESISKLYQQRPNDKFTRDRVDAIDISEAFNFFTSVGKENSVLSFAPFGPKPISVAMCLYAIETDSAVHYPQPTSYHPDYSTGIAKVGDTEKVSAYWIKHEGRDLYMV